MSLYLYIPYIPHIHIVYSTKSLTFWSIKNQAATADVAPAVSAVTLSLAGDFRRATRKSDVREEEGHLIVLFYWHYICIGRLYLPHPFIAIHTDKFLNMMFFFRRCYGFSSEILIKR
jgi:hypothetical protein